VGVLNNYESITWNLKKKEKRHVSLFYTANFLITILKIVNKQLYQHQNQLFFLNGNNYIFLVDSYRAFLKKKC